jgi:hypothetical protein
MYLKMDIYIKPLSSDETTLLYLKVFLNEVSICKHILYYKKSIEHEETIKYHTHRWVNIAGEHLYMKTNHTNNFSYIINDDIYNIKVDMQLKFFNLTGISYQIIDMLHQLILILNINDFDITNLKKNWLKNDDKLYSILSKKIMDKMKPKKRKNYF